MEALLETTFLAAQASINTLLIHKNTFTSSLREPIQHPTQLPHPSQSLRSLSAKQSSLLSLEVTPCGAVTLKTKVSNIQWCGKYRITIIKTSSQKRAKWEIHSRLWCIITVKF